MEIPLSVHEKVSISSRVYTMCSTRLDDLVFSFVSQLTRLMLTCIKRFVLGEIIKNSNVHLDILVKFIQAHELEPNFGDLITPPGQPCFLLLTFARFQRN